MTQTNLARSTVTGIFWVAIENWGVRILSLVVFSVLGHILQPADFGLVALAMAVAVVIQVFVENGLAQALVQRDELHKRDADTAFWTSLGIGVLLYGVLMAFAPLLVILYDEPRMVPIMAVTGLVLPLSGLSSVPAALLARDLLFKKLAYRKLGGAFAGAVVALAMALGGAGLWALVLQPVATAVASAIILWSASTWRPRFTWALSSIRRLWAFSVQVVAIELLNAIQANIDKFVVGVFFGPTILGYYYVGQRVLAIAMEVVGAVLARVSLSAFSRLQGDDQRLHRYFTSLTFGSATLAFPLFGILIAFGGSITAFLFGPGWGPSVPVMALLAPSAMLGSVVLFDKSLLLAKGRGGVSLMVALGQFIFGTVVLFAAIPLGIQGVAASRSIRQVVYWPVRIFALRRYAGLSPRLYLRQFVSPTIGTLVLVGFGYLAENSAWSDAPWSPVLYLIPAISLSVALYCATVWLTARRELRSITTALRGTGMMPART